VTSPVKFPTNAVEVIELNPVPTPPVNCAVPSDTIGNCTFFPATPEIKSSSAKVLPASCKVYPDSKTVVLEVLSPLRITPLELIL